MEGLPPDELHTMAWDAATKAIEETVAAGRPVAFVHVSAQHGRARAERYEPTYEPSNRKHGRTAATVSMPRESSL